MGAPGTSQDFALEDAIGGSSPAAHTARTAPLAPYPGRRRHRT